MRLIRITLISSPNYSKRHRSMRRQHQLFSQFQDIKTDSSKFVEDKTIEIVVTHIMTGKRETITGLEEIISWSS